MKILLFFLFLALPLFAFAQLNSEIVEYLKKVNSPNIIQSQRYDSLSNWTGDDIGEYIGQSLILKGAEGMETYGVGGLRTIPTYDILLNSDKSYVYKRLKDTYYSNFNQIQNLKFYVSKVLVFDKNPACLKKTYLELITDNDETVYYELPEYWQDFNDTFIVSGYFEKMKKLLIGKKFIYNGVDYYNVGTEYYGIRDLDSKEEKKNISKGSLWKCSDVKYLNNGKRWLVAIIENEDYGKSYVSVQDFFNGITNETSKFINKTEMDLIVQRNINEKALILKKYGKQISDMIAKGTVRIGWTEQMCIYSWGKPDDINTTKTQSGISEQWVYPNEKYLYFKNGKLTAIQE